MMGSFAAAERTSRIDTRALKQIVRLEEVAAGYGVELKRQGRALVGRCPLHTDGGRPNFYVYAEQEPQSWRCYRCGVGGDVVALAMRVENIGFREAVERIDAGRLHAPPRVSRPIGSRPRSMLTHVDRAPDEVAVLQAATSLYHQQLLGEPRALEYLCRRGIGRELVREHRLGYASGDALLAYLRWRQLPLGAALRVGVLTHAGQDFLDGRLVVPHLDENRRATWLIGRALRDDLSEDTPRYLGLPGPKPLLGYEQARGSPSACVVEGAFDLFALRQWGYPPSPCSARAFGPTRSSSSVPSSGCTWSSMLTTRELPLRCSWQVPSDPLRCRLHWLTASAIPPSSQRDPTATRCSPRLCWKPSACPPPMPGAVLHRSDLG